MSNYKENILKERAQDTNRLVLLEFVDKIGDLPLETPKTVADKLMEDGFIDNSDTSVQRRGKIHLTKKGRELLLEQAQKRALTERVISHSGVLGGFLKQLADKPEDVKGVVQELLSMMPVVPLTDAQAKELAGELGRSEDAFRTWVQYMQNLRILKRESTKLEDKVVDGQEDEDGISVGGLNTREKNDSQNPVPGPRGGEEKLEV